MKTKILMALLAGATLLAACKGSGSLSATDLAKADSASADSVKLVKTADMRIKVSDVKKVSVQVSKLAIEAGGTVMHHTIKSDIVDKRDIPMPHDSVKKLTVYNTTADITIKVPSAYAEIFMDSLNQLGSFVDQSNLNVEDRTLDFLAQKLKAENRNASVKLRSKIKLTSHVADSILMLKDDVVDRKLSNLRTEDASKYSTLTLQLYQNSTISKEIVPSNNLSDYNNPLGTRLVMAISNGWNFFSTMVIGLLNLWAFIITGLLFWGGVVLYKRKKTRIGQPGA